MKYVLLSFQQASHQVTSELIIMSRTNSQSLECKHAKSLERQLFRMLVLEI